MARIIFDIETAGHDFETMDKPVQEYLLRWAESEDDKTEVKKSLSFYPLTGEIITIGMFDPDKSYEQFIETLDCFSKRASLLTHVRRLTV